MAASKTTLEKAVTVLRLLEGGEAISPENTQVTQSTMAGPSGKFLRSVFIFYLYRCSSEPFTS